MNKNNIDNELVSLHDNGINVVKGNMDDIIKNKEYDFLQIEVDYREDAMMAVIEVLKERGHDTITVYNMRYNDLGDQLLVQLMYEYHG